ncbi:DNA polymerase III subunit delta [Oricola cellulosilytica]|uniref:DNA-directed DNA polymerase n=1 Tax=Oricola cellulosilytica TaxID=1429082 RepID=A0A4R0PK04_9HYPH|nr:DNA polymerase III subunit delta [Oricola cellulosilytica]TCD15979.1 DNA polymerase III subunit delta [Oricola cellulosilytica]
MAELKAGDVERYLHNPDSSHSLFLVYGPDRGLVSERAEFLARKSGIDLNDAFSVIKLDASELVGDPARLTDEAYTVAMFGGDRLIWLRNVGSHKEISAVISGLLTDPPEAVNVIIEAGDLKKGTALRAIVEKSKAGVTLPCYSDSPQGLNALIDSAVAESGKRLSTDARRYIQEHIGGDRRASRGELEKLMLYARNEDEITLEMARACMGDASAISFDDVVDAVIIGDLPAFDSAMQAFVSAGSNPAPLLAAAIRQFQQLDVLRSEMDISRRSPASVIATARPPVFFSRRKTVESALSRWTHIGIRNALKRLQECTLESRMKSALSVAIARTTLLAITIQSARRR